MRADHINRFLSAADYNPDGDEITSVRVKVTQNTEYDLTSHVSYVVEEGGVQGQGKGSD